MKMTERCHFHDTTTDEKADVKTSALDAIRAAASA
jgi:hypothetical protein